jgi:hypothetical protein
VKFNQVYGPPKETFECLLKFKEVRKAVCHPWLEFHDHIDITALGIKVTAQDRSEYLEFAHPMKATQPADLLDIVVDQRGHVSEPSRVPWVIFYPDAG